MNQPLTQERSLHQPYRGSYSARPWYVVLDDSMQGDTDPLSMPKGCQYGIDPDRTPYPGDLVLVEDTTTGTLAVRRLADIDCRLVLQPLNDTFRAVDFTGVLDVIGVVVEVVRQDCHGTEYGRRVGKEGEWEWMLYKSRA